MSFRDVGDVVARYFQQQGLKKQNSDDLAAFGKFTTAAGDYLSRRNAPRPEPMAFDALNPAGDAVDSLDLEAIRDGIPFSDEAPQMPQAASQPGAPRKVGQPGSNAFEELGLNDLMSLHQLSAENNSPHNAAVLSDLVNIWKGRDKSGAAMDLAAARMQGQMDLMGKRFEGQAGLEGKKHGYRMDEIGARGDIQTKVAEVRARAAERAKKAEDTGRINDLQDMRDHYTGLLIQAKSDLDKIEDNPPMQGEGDLDFYGDFTDGFKQKLSVWKMDRRALESEIRQYQSLIGRAMEKGAKPKEPAPNTPGGAAAPASRVRVYNLKTGRFE